MKKEKKTAGCLPDRVFYFFVAQYYHPVENSPRLSVDAMYERFFRMLDFILF